MLAEALKQMDGILAGLLLLFYNNQLILSYQMFSLFQMSIQYFGACCPGF